VLPRSRIERVDIGRAGLLQGYQRALVVTCVDGRSARLFPGISAIQAEFVKAGLQRWLAGD
jgi:hypothetical protein